MRDTAGSAAAAADRCRNSLRWGSFSMMPLRCFDQETSCARTETLWNILARYRRVISVRFRTGELNHLAPLVGLVGDELAEIGGRVGKHHATRVRKPRPEAGMITPGGGSGIILSP